MSKFATLLGRVAVLAGLSGLAVLSGFAAAQAVDDTTVPALRSLVERQIEAFRRDDAAGAYALASPAIRGLFGPARDGDAGPELALRIQDADGADWDAVYSFERQPDGSWAISGCRLVKAPGESV